MKLIKSKLGAFLLICFLFAAALFVWGFLIEPDRLVVRHYDLKLKNWERALDNFKIVAVSDIHGGSNFIDEEKIRRITELVNEQQPDLIVLLGDFVSEEIFDSRKLKMPVATIAGALQNLKATQGVFAVIGNHDGYYNQRKVRSELEKVGIRVLENEIVSVSRGGAGFRLLGLPNSLSREIPGSEILSAEDALKISDPADGKLLILTHHPDDIADYQNRICRTGDCHLFLAGHTHGGQIRIPFIGALIVPTNLGRHYAAGRFENDGAEFFITPGIGTSIIPARFNSPPEISVLTVSRQ